MVTVKCFAQVREIAKDSELKIKVAPGTSVSELMQKLQARNSNWQHALSQNVLIACNHTLVDESHRIESGDEVAFFPPVTGG